MRAETAERIHAGAGGILLPGCSFVHNSGGPRSRLPELNTDPLQDLPQAIAFLRAIEPLSRAYVHGTFTFVAYLHHGEKVILRAQMRLMVDTPLSTKRSVATTHLVAGQIAFTLDNVAVDTYLRSIVAGAWLPQLGGHLVKLVPRNQPSTPKYLAYHEPADPQHLRTKGAIERLVLSGISSHQLTSARMVDIAGDLRGLGIESLSLLFEHYELQGSDDSSLEIIAGPVARLEPESVISGRRAQVRISLATPLSPDRLRVTARNGDPNVSELPASIAGADLSWSSGGAYRHAQWEFDLPEDTPLDCSVVYSGGVQSEKRLSDLTSTPNRLWRALEQVDPKLERLQELLLSPKMQGKESRDFEAATTWLLQLLGFTVVHLGGMSRLDNEPDVFAQTPSGDLILVECSIEVPDDKKLNRFVARVQRWHRLIEIQESTGEPVTLTPILMCPLSYAELAGAREKTEQHSIFILYKEDIAEALHLAKFQPNANFIVRHWRGRPLREIQTQGIRLT